MIRFALTVLGAVALAPTAVLAQGNQGADALAERPQTSGEAREVQVGAGTTAQVTLGNSGPKTKKAEQPGGLPPLPTAELCKGHEGRPAHADCLAKVLKD